MSKKPNHDSDDPISMFEVSAGGVLRLADFEDPKTRREVYDIETDWSRSPRTLANAMADCRPLEWEIRSIYDQARDELVAEVASLVAAERTGGTADKDAPCSEAEPDRSLAEKRRQLAKMPEDEEDALTGWLEGLEQSYFDSVVVPAVDAWLAAAPDWNMEGDEIPEIASGEGAAFALLENCEWTDLFGIEIVDGVRPGDSTRAALLTGGIAKANAVAKANGLPIRFVRPRAMVKTAVDAATVSAYEATGYLVAARKPFVLRVRQASLPLEALHSAHGVRSSCFVTACNPFSGPLTDEENAVRQAALRAELQRAGLILFEGAGQHPSNGWPPEPSYLVLGIDRVAACELGRRWEQNAIVWSGPEAIPELILLR